MRPLLVTLGAAGLIAAGFGITFTIWHHGNAARAVALGVPYTTYNWETVFAQQRGCAACHGGHLAADVSRVPVPRPAPVLHGIFMTSYGIPMRVEDCLPCHGGATTLPFAESIHSLHLQSAAFADMGGECSSCHVLTHGKFLLYDDETRYAVMNGVVKIPTPPFAAVQR